jgi:hypothetical protein
MVSPLWPWLAIGALGAFHGLNPAMGWLFAVALGLHRGSRAVVLYALLAVALGHALSILAVVAAVAGLGAAFDPRPIHIVGGLVLIGWAVYHWLYGSRHRLRIGIRTGYAGLIVWSAAIATGHGAGLMLVPVLMPMGVGAGVAAPMEMGAGMPAGHMHGGIAGSLPTALAAVVLHTLCMLIVAGLIALVVYDWTGLAFLRRGWINLDLLWTAALIAAGLLLLVT